MHPILLIMWTAFQSFILRDNNNNNNNNNNNKIINWTLQELAKLDTKTRKSLTMYKMYHPNKSDVHRLYLPRTEGGRGLLQLELS